MPWVNFGDDLAAILAGRAIREGNRFTVHGRDYVMEGGGRLYPVSGPGLYQLSRGGYRALALYNVRGLNAEAEAQLDLDGIIESERERAREVWRALQAWFQRRV